MKKNNTNQHEDKLKKELEVKRIKKIMSRPIKPHATFEYWALK